MLIKLASLATVALSLGLTQLPSSDEAGVAQSTTTLTRTNNRAVVHPRFPNLSLDHMVARSDSILAGVVRIADETVRGQTPCMRYRIEVTHDLLDDLADEIDVVVPGSASQDFVVEGAPRFESGDELLLFVRQIPGSEEFALNALSQGTYRVQEISASDSSTVSGAHTRGEEPLIDFLGRVYDVHAALQHQLEQQPR